MARQPAAITAKNKSHVSSIIAILLVVTAFFRQHMLAQPAGQWYRVPAPGDVQRVFIRSDSTLFACTNTGLYTENLRTEDWKFYSSADGFIGNNVYSLVQDSAENLYFASSPVSVCRNSSFTSFPLDSTREAMDIVIDRKGRIWCAAWNSVYEDGPAGWNQFTGIGEGSHLVLALDSVGNVWCGGGDSDINYYDSLGWHLEQYFDQGIKGTATALTVSHDGTIWVGTGGCNLGHRVNGMWSLVGPNLFPWSLSGIAVSNDTVWVTARSLFRGIGSTWTQFKASDGLADDNPISAAFDRWNHLWIGHPGGRLSVLNGGTWSIMKLKSALPDFHASSVAVNSLGLAYVGTKAGGLAFFNGASWETIQTGLPSDTVTVVRFDNFGNLWVGTPNGIGMYNGSSWKHFTITDGLLSNSIASIAVSNNNLVWCSTGSSLARFNGSSWNSYPIPTSIGVIKLRDIAIDSAGTIWAASDSGIIRFDGDSFQHYFPAMLRSGMNSIAVDQHGIKWCASDSAGAWRFNDTEWTLLDWQKVGPAPITSVRVSPTGSVWFGSSGEQGVYRFDGTAWSHFSETDGLGGGDIHDFAFGNGGNVWIASELGVTVYNENGVVLSTPTARHPQSPANFELMQNFPNPFNPATRIMYTLASKSYVQISVYNILGQLVRKLVHQLKEAGNYSIEFDASGLPSGVYIYRLSASGNAGSFVRSRKMILLR